jgi:hypothetical protein
VVECVVAYGGVHIKHPLQPYVCILGRVTSHDVILALEGPTCAT